MERITRKIGKSIDFVDGKGYASLSHEELTRLLFERLAEYEDIGLSASEIKYFLKDFGVTVTKRNRELIKELQEYRRLKMKKRLIELPCNVGDLVYEVNLNRNIISSYRVTSIIVMTDSKNYNWELVEGIYSNLNGFNEFALGKTVFLTREEAEKVLKESDV